LPSATALTLLPLASPLIRLASTLLRPPEAGSEAGSEAVSEAGLGARGSLLCTSIAVAVRQLPGGSCGLSRKPAAVLKPRLAAVAKPPGRAAGHIAALLALALMLVLADGGGASGSVAAPAQAVEG
jgi:hypothetical protein